MRNHAYIKLVVDDQLSPEDTKLWRDTAKSSLPSGLPAEAEILVNGATKSSDFYIDKSSGSWCYIVPLSRDPNLDEVKAVVRAWHLAYPQGDFEIDYSNTGTAKTKKKAIQDIALREVAYEAAKLSHNAWIQEMMDQGWRYGIKYNPREKQNPNMLPWDQINKRYQLHEMKRVEKLLEILHNLNLRLVRK